MVFIIREEFEQHGLSHIIVSEHRDVCEKGFGISHVADAGKATK
jgi:hypothetical protein